MRQNGTPGAFGRGRPTTPRPTTPKGCNFRRTEVWCLRPEECHTCTSEMTKRAVRRSLQQTADLGRMMRQARTV